MKALSQKMLDVLVFVHRHGGATAVGWTRPAPGYDITSQTAEALEARKLVKCLPYPGGGRYVTITTTGLEILAEKQNGKLSELSEKELQKRIAALEV